MRSLGRRLLLEGPSTGWYAGHGGDEYGNCSLYLRTPWFGVVVFVPDPGTHPWIDAKYYPSYTPDDQYSRSFTEKEEGKP